MFCPKCGKEMRIVREVYGRFRFHDFYFGCEDCNLIFEDLSRRGRDRHIYLEECGELSRWLEDVAKERAAKDQKIQQDELRRQHEKNKAAEITLTL